MKTRKTFLILLTAIIACMLILGGCPQKSKDLNVYTMDKDASYAVGMFLASQWSYPNLSYDYQLLMEGFRAYNEALETKFDMNTAVMKINAAMEVWAMQMGFYDDGGYDSGDDDFYLEAGLYFLAENGMREGVVTTSSGLQYEILALGSGARPSASDVVRVHYEGTLIDGTVFDSSYARGEAIEFALNQVIPGWTEGVQLMNEGSIYRLFIPSELGYGSRGAGSIPPNSALIFQVELLAIVK